MFLSCNTSLTHFVHEGRIRNCCDVSDIVQEALIELQTLNRKLRSIIKAGKASLDIKSSAHTHVLTSDIICGRPLIRFNVYTRRPFDIKHSHGRSRVESEN